MTKPITARILKVRIEEKETQFDAICRAGSEVNRLNKLAGYPLYKGYEIVCNICNLPIDDNHDCKTLLRK